MSKNRYTKTIPEKDLPKGPNGRNLCRWCKTEVKPPRRTMCSEACVHEYSIRCNPAYARSHVEKRDKGVCALCSLDTWKLERVINKLLRLIGKPHYIRRPGDNRYDSRYGWGWERLAIGERRKATAINRLDAIVAQYPRAFTPSRYCSYQTATSLWQSDHIIPVVEGGGECGLENLRTLCTNCHRKETKELHARLKKSRKKPL